MCMVSRYFMELRDLLFVLAEGGGFPKRKWPQHGHDGIPCM